MPNQQSLLQMSRALLSSFDLGVLLDNVAESLTQAMGGDKTVIMLWGPAGSSQLRVAAAFDRRGQPKTGRRLIDLADQPLLAQAIRSRTRQAFDKHQSPQQVEALGRLLDYPDCSGVLLHPLIYQEWVLGLLVLAAGSQREAFTSQERALCSSLAEPIAAAIANAGRHHHCKAQTAALLRRLREQQHNTNAQLAILESIGDGVLVSDAQGRVQLVNTMAEEMLGIGRSELLGEPLSTILKQMPMFGVSLDERRGASRRQVTFRLHGKVLQGSMSTITGDEGQFLGAVATLRDVTRIHRAERTKEEFITTLSHELRTPLTAMKGYLELLNSGVGGPLAERQQSFLDVIQRNANRMVDLVNSLILVTQTQEGRVEPVYSHADLKQIIRQVVREHSLSAQEHQVTVQIELADDALIIQADPIQLYLIIERLLNNGIKYTPAGGKVTISAALQLGDATDDERYAVITVQDTGIGIPPEQQSRVFEQFYRLDERPLDVEGGGIGVGLSIVKTLVEAHGGRIWMESAVDQGSTFTFIIPVERRGSLPWLLERTDGLIRRTADQ